MSYHGLREKRYNRSTVIDRFNRAAGVPVGSSWCMSYVYYSYDAASDALGVETPILRTASVSQQLRFAKSPRSKGRLQVIPIRGVIGAAKLYEPQPGDIIIWKRRGGSPRDIGQLWPGHTGIVRWGGVDRVLTIEGNTGGNFADGDGVYSKWRPKSNILAIIRVVDE